MAHSTDLPPIEVDLLNAIFAELGTMDVQLDSDPLEFGPKRMNNKVAKARSMLSQCERIFLQTSHSHQLYKRTHRAAQLQFDLQLQDMFANDPETRAGKNVQDRNAIATMKMRAEREALMSLEVTIQDLEMLLTVVKAKRADLRDIQVRLAAQQKLCEAEIGLGARWGSRPPPGTEAPDLARSPMTDRSALDRIQDILQDAADAAEVHLEVGDANWIADEPEANDLVAVEAILTETADEAILTETADEEDEDGGLSFLDEDEVSVSNGEDLGDLEPVASGSLMDDDEPVGEADAVDALLAEVDSFRSTEEPAEPLGWCGVPGCGKTVFNTPSGTTCAAGHGGAEVLDHDPQLSTPPAAKAEVLAPEQVSSPDVAEIVDLDALFSDNSSSESSKTALAAVTTDSDVDSLFDRIAVTEPAAKKKSPVVEDVDIDTLIDMFAS